MNPINIPSKSNSFKLSIRIIKIKKIYKSDINIDIDDIIKQHILITLNILNFFSDNTIYSLLPHTNIRNKISQPKKINSNKNNKTPIPFSILFYCLITQLISFSDL